MTDRITDREVKKFLRKIVKPLDGLGCWKWVGAQNLAIAHPEGGRVLARDIAWFIHTGSVPQVGFTTSCDDRLCMNPEHFVAKARMGRPSLEPEERKRRKTERQRMWRAKRREPRS